MRRALALSAAAHAAVLAAVLLWRLHAGAPPAEVTAEMVFVDPGGGAPAAPQQPRPQQPPPVPPADPARQEPSQPAAAPAPAMADGGAEPVPPAAPPQPRSQPPPRNEGQQAAAKPRDTEASAPPSVRLGDEDGAGSTDEIIADRMAVGPDPAAPNIPPRYPPAAARRGQQGTVMLEVIVAPDGQARDVVVYTSSGFPMLDQAAQGAVAHWRFVPKTERGVAVVAHTMVRVSFRLD